MTQQETFHFLQYLFDNTKARDQAYGRRTILAGDIDRRTDEVEFLYQQKSSHKTGGRHWYGRPEIIPTIEMLVQLNGIPFERLHLPGVRDGNHKIVNNATLEFTARSYDGTKLKSIQSTLERESRTLDVLDHEFKLWENRNIGDRLVGIASGPIRPMLALHEFAMGCGLKYETYKLE